MATKSKVTKKTAKRTPSAAAGKKDLQGEKVTQLPTLNAEDLTLVERVQREKKATEGKGRGAKREITRWAFALWLMTPARFRGEDPEYLKKLGMRDPDTLEILSCGTQREFEKKFLIGHNAVAEWKREIEASDEGKDIRAFFRPLMKEGLGALYAKLLENGDAERFKVLAAYTEGWIPTIGLQHSGEIGGGLLPEEQAELDRLLAKNAQV
jgi:hypothetical protein